MFGDYNRDGVIDISYMSSTWNLGYDHTGVGVRLGTRPGEFGSTRTIHRMATTNDREVHAADFNGDGKVDLLSLFTARCRWVTAMERFKVLFQPLHCPALLPMELELSRTSIWMAFSIT